jgi:hypothetical protein
MGVTAIAEPLNPDIMQLTSFLPTSTLYSCDRFLVGFSEPRRVENIQESSDCYQRYLERRFNVRFSYLVRARIEAM